MLPLSAALMMFARFGVPRPVGKSQPGVAGSGFAPSVTSKNAFEPAELEAIPYRTGFAAPSGVGWCFAFWCAAFTRAHIPAHNGDERLVPPSAKWSEYVFVDGS